LGESEPLPNIREKEGQMRRAERRLHGVIRGGTWAVLAVVGALVLTWAGCSSGPPPGPPQPTTQQIRSDSDRFFDKMKQDEKEHAGQVK
jgi:hypothetical protein